MESLYLCFFRSICLLYPTILIEGPSLYYWISHKMWWFPCWSCLLCNLLFNAINLGLYCYFFFIFIFLQNNFLCKGLTIGKLNTDEVISLIQCFLWRFSLWKLKLPFIAFPCSGWDGIIFLQGHLGLYFGHFSIHGVPKVIYLSPFL